MIFIAIRLLLTYSLSTYITIPHYSAGTEQRYGTIFHYVLSKYHLKKLFGYNSSLCIDIYLMLGKIVMLQNVWINVIPNLGSQLLNSTYMGLFSFKNCLFGYLSFINFFISFEKRPIKTSLFGCNSGVASLYMSHRFLSFLHLKNYHDIFHIRFLPRYHAFQKSKKYF